MNTKGVEDGTATCRTCMLPIHRAEGYETCAIDLAIWKHPNGKESCDGFGLWARAMPDLNPTRGVEETDRKVARDKFMLEATERASKDFAARWTKGVEDGIGDERVPKFSRTIEWAVQFENRSGNKISVRKTDQIEARAIYDKARIGNNEVAVRLMRYEEVVVAERFNERGSK